MTETTALPAVPGTDADRLVIDGVELSSRLIMGTGGAPSLDGLGAALLASGTAACGQQHPGPAEYRRLLHREGCGHDGGAGP
jgi:hypothetical protein